MVEVDVVEVDVVEVDVVEVDVVEVDVVEVAAVASASSSVTIVLSAATICEDRAAAVLGTVGNVHWELSRPVCTKGR